MSKLIEVKSISVFWYKIQYVLCIPQLPVVVLCYAKGYLVFSYTTEFIVPIYIQTWTHIPTLVYGPYVAFSHIYNARTRTHAHTHTWAYNIFGLHTLEHMHIALLIWRCVCASHNNSMTTATIPLSCSLYTLSMLDVRPVSLFFYFHYIVTFLFSLRFLVRYVAQRRSIQRLCE